MKLSGILSNYYTQRELASLVKLLKQEDLYDEWQTSAQGYYGLDDCETRPAREEDLRQLLSDYLRITFGRLQALPNTPSNQKTTKTIFSALAQMMNHAGYFSMTETAVFNQILNDFSLLLLKEGITQSWLQISLLNHLIVTYPYDPVSAKALQENEAKTSGFTLIYQKMPGDAVRMTTKRDFIKDLLELFRELECQGALEALFDPGRLLKQIHIKRDDLKAFLVLFGLMVECGRIKCSPHKGLYGFLRSRLVAAGKQDLPERANFSKIKSEALAHAETRAWMAEFLYDFFKKYCPPDKFQTIWDKHFGSNPPSTMESL